MADTGGASGHRRGFWLALLAGTIAVVAAAAELSGADDPPGMTIGLWSVVAVLGFRLRPSGSTSRTGRRRTGRAPAGRG